MHSFAQESQKKGKAVGVNFTLTDFETAADIRSSGLVKALKSKEFFSTSRMSPGFSISYLSGLSKNVDFISTLGGAFLDYPINGMSTGSDKFLLDVTAQLNLKLLPDNYFVTPYIDLGAGASTYDGGFAAFIPAGLGLQFTIAKKTFVLVNSQYRIPVTEKASYHFQHSIGIVRNISTKKMTPVVPAVPAPVVPVVQDRDGDGVPDSEDRCPDEAGSAELKGCPDRDGDGIADIDDKCPNVPGVARYDGCPIPDSDGDGVNDEEDKCPTVPGPASNHGCPVVEQEVIAKVDKAAENIFFASGSAKLLEKSFASLDDVVALMKENPTFHIEISGHTDITGGTELNQKLSESRAESVKQYLLEQGIDEDRITAKGYGETMPIADNKTAAGRAKNRRVEMKLKNY